MHRGVAAACASMVTCLALYPIDVWKTAGQLRLKRPQHTNVYSGMLPDLCGSFLGSGAYFTTYEAARSAFPLNEPFNTGVGSACGALASCLVKSPLSVAKKRRQAALLFDLGVSRWSGRLLRESFLLDVAKSLPRAIVKYVIYENLMKLFMLAYERRTACVFSAAIAAVCAYAISLPIDNRKTVLALTAPTDTLRGVSFNGLGRGTLLTVMSNVLGHFLLETWAPRFTATS